MERKTKILAIGDIHGDSGLVKKLAERAERENVDLVIIAGDITMLGKDTKNLISPFVKVKKQVLLIPGNHEPDEVADFLAELYPDTKNIHGYHFYKNGVGIFGAGGADIGPFSSRNSEIFRLLQKGHSTIKDAKKKIMVTHMHPKGSKSEFSGFEGSAGIRKAIKEFHPDILINAHIHEAGGIEEKIGKTRVINVSRKAKVFEI